MKSMIKHPTASGYILDLKMGNLSSIFSIFDKIRLSDISELILSYNNLHELEDLFFQMRNLFVLNVSVNQIKEIANLDNCQKLESLNLSTNRITKFKGLEGLKALIRLDLSMNYIEKIEVLTLFNLRILNISHNNLRKLENLETLINLESLDVSKNKIQDLGCLETGLFKKLRRLFCSHNQIPANYLEKFGVSLRNFINIEEIDFLGNEICQNKDFQIEIAKSLTLKIVNGGPVIISNKSESVNNIRKNSEKQKSEVKLAPSYSTDFMKFTYSMKDINKGGDDLANSQKSEDFMQMISNHSIMKSTEKFRNNQEFLAKLKQSANNELIIQAPIVKSNNQTPIITSKLQKSPSHILTNTIDTPKNNTKRPSAFLIRNNEDLNSRKTHDFEEKRPEEILRNFQDIMLSQTSIIQKKLRTPEKNLSIIPDKMLFESNMISKRHSKPPTTIKMESTPDIKRGSIVSLEDPRKSSNSHNSKESSPKQNMESSKDMVSLNNSSKSKSKENSQNLSSEERKVFKLTMKTGSQKNILLRKNKAQSHELNISVNSKISNEVTEKLKERFEKFKENSKNSRRNSDIVKLNKKNIDWKEKRMEFLRKKQEKLEEEDSLMKNLKRGALNSPEKSENKSQICNVF